jgi:hypothetical protein
MKALQRAHRADKGIRTTAAIVTAAVTVVL